MLRVSQKRGMKVFIEGPSRPEARRVEIKSTNQSLTGTAKKIAW